MKHNALKEGRQFFMKRGAKEIMWMIKTAFREYKQKAEVKQLGLAGLRRNGQLAAAPKGSKIVARSRPHQGCR